MFHSICSPNSKAVVKRPFALATLVVLAVFSSPETWSKPRVKNSRAATHFQSSLAPLQCRLPEAHYHNPEIKFLGKTTFSLSTFSWTLCTIYGGEYVNSKI